MSRRCCLALTLALAALAALVAPVPAAAGTASTRTTTVSDRHDPPETVISLRYRAGRGERNRLRIEVDATGATLTDRARVRPAAGCRRVAGSARRTVRCQFRGLEKGLAGGFGDRVGVRVQLRDRADTAVVGGEPPDGADLLVSLEGGPGPDRLRSNADSGTFVGGAGNDKMTGGPDSDVFLEGRRRNGADTMRGGSSSLPDSDVVNYDGRRGRVVADLAGDRDDGAPGERDRIGADVESLRAGSGSDRLTGNAAANVLDGGGGRFDVIRGGRGRDVLSTHARGGVVRSRDGENDSIGCRTARTRALVDGYDLVGPRCTLRRSEPVGFLVDTVFALFEVSDRVGIADAPLAVRFRGTCPADAAPMSCGGQAHLLAGDGRLLGQTAFDVSRRERGESLTLPVGEADRQRIRAAGEEHATLLLDMPGVPQRRYPVTLTAP